MSEVNVYDLDWAGTPMKFVTLGEYEITLANLDAQRLRADTAEAELAKANDKIDKAWRSSHKLDDKAYIPGAFDAWKRPVPQFLPYDFSGNPGTSATQYCNGWNDCGGYWKAHATEVEVKLADAEQRIAELVEWQAKAVSLLKEGQRLAKKDGSSLWEVVDEFLSALNQNSVEN